MLTPCPWLWDPVETLSGVSWPPDQIGVAICGQLHPALSLQPVGAGCQVFKGRLRAGRLAPARGGSGGEASLQEAHEVILKAKDSACRPHLEAEDAAQSAGHDPVTQGAALCSALGSSRAASFLLSLGRQTWRAGGLPA